MKTAARILFLASCLLCAAAVYLCLYRPAAPTEIVIAEPNRSSVTVPVGESDFVFRVMNPTSVRARIVGLQES